MRTHKILIVEDEKELLPLLTLSLETVGHTVSSTADPREALELLKSQKFDLVICDVQMPNLTGLELFACVRELPHRPVFLFCSGLIEAPLNAPYPDGVSGLLAKPYTLPALLAEIERAL